MVKRSSFLLFPLLILAAGVPNILAVGISLDSDLMYVGFDNSVQQDTLGKEAGVHPESGFGGQLGLHLFLENAWPFDLFKVGFFLGRSLKRYSVKGYQVDEKWSYDSMLYLGSLYGGNYLTRQLMLTFGTRFGYVALAGKVTPQSQIAFDYSQTSDLSLMITAEAGLEYFLSRFFSTSIFFGWQAALPVEGSREVPNTSEGKPDRLRHSFKLSASGVMVNIGTHYYFGGLTTLLKGGVRRRVPDYRPPKTYVRDERIVYLIQHNGFTPIQYQPVKTDPYVWDVSKQKTKKKSFLGLRKLERKLAASATSATLYAQIRFHLNRSMNNKAFQRMKSDLNRFTFAKLKKHEYSKGKLVATKKKAKKFVYPLVAGAFLVERKKGKFEIRFNDKSVYWEKPNGDYGYIRPDEESQQYFEAKTRKFFEKKDGKTYFRDDKDKGLVFQGSEIAYLTSGGNPQYFYRPGGKKLTYHFHIAKNSKVNFLSVKKAKLRFSYRVSDTAVLIDDNVHLLTISSDGATTYSEFDRLKQAPGNILQVGFPEGIRVHGFEKTLTRSTVKPRWPEKYKIEQVAGFNLLVTTKDRPLLLANIDPIKLKRVRQFVEEKSGLAIAKGRSVIFPPNLKAYRKIHADAKTETLNWYPSGFEQKDVIVLWPPSVRRYQEEAGQTYFWNEEIYDILVHEMVHMAVGEHTGVFGQVPVWINEGLAVWTTSQWNRREKEYWETTFEASHGYGILLPWEDVTMRSTGSYPIAQARVHYAQSYKMVDYLIAKSGVKNLRQYIRSFRFNGRSKGSDLRSLFKRNFHRIYKTSWANSLKDFKLSIRKKAS